MNYKVLYRKYRPSTFDEVVGQNNTINILKDSINNEKISHAYIFSGPRGTGKTSCAKIFAKAINCSQNKEGNPCNKCENCLNSTNSNDIFEIDAASNNGVDQIREIIDNIKLTPITSKYKVYIIDEVHMLSNSAFNALLLTLEEPPSHAVFILATTNIEEVPITVLSRCQRMDFHKISLNDIFENLKEVSKKENIDITDEALIDIADYSDGGMRDALSMLDQLSKIPDKITSETVLKSIGLISNKELENILINIEEGNIESIENSIENMKKLSSDYKLIIKKLIEITKQKAIKVKLGNIESNLNYNDYKNLCFDLASCIYKHNVNLDSYSMLELVLIGCIKEKNISREIKIDNSKVKEKNVNITTKSVETKWEIIEDTTDIINEINNIRLNNCFALAEKSQKENCQNNWNKFIDSNKSDKLIIKFIDSNVALASKDILILVNNLPGNIEYLLKNINKVADLFNKQNSTNYKFGIISIDQWEKEVEKYKTNLKAKIKYEIKEEPKIEETKKVMKDIFDDNKIEIR